MKRNQIPLKKSPLKRGTTPLKRNKGINKISRKKQVELLGEYELRAILCSEAGGVLDFRIIDGVPVYACRNGICQKCGKRRDLDFEHEKKKSLGGKSTRANCRMWCRLCHTTRHQGNMGG